MLLYVAFHVTLKSVDLILEVQVAGVDNRTNGVSVSLSTVEPTKKPMSYKLEPKAVNSLKTMSTVGLPNLT